MNDGITRREFTKAGAAAAVGLAGVTRSATAAGANDTIRLGVIGIGNRGSQVADAFMTHKDCKIVCAADLYTEYLDRAKEKIGSDLDTYEDYQKVLDRQDVDAVVIATPDHWHAIQMIEAVNAGKDVYVEKPLASTIHEGRAMVQAAERTGKVVQVGLQRRSMDIYGELAQFLGQDKLGHISVARAYRISNMAPDGIGRSPKSKPPAGFDWNKWLGPRPRQEYQDNITPYKFRWWLGYSSQMGNWGVHYFDTIRWMMGVDAPAAAVAMGGQYAVDDDRTIPDTAEALFELPTQALLVFGQYETSHNPALAWGEIELRGTQGTVYSSYDGYKVLQERGGQFQDSGKRGKAIEVAFDQSHTAATVAHTRNFLDCVKTRQTPNCPVIEGHRSTNFAHLANISLATKSRLDWDAKAEKFNDNPAANDLLHYEYENGYKLPG